MAEPVPVLGGHRGLRYNFSHAVYSCKFTCSLVSRPVPDFPQILNHDVFKHTGISWEWGIVFVEAILFFAGIEAWKWGKRIFFRRRSRNMSQTSDDLEKRGYGEFITKRSENGNAVVVPAKNEKQADA